MYSCDLHCTEPKLINQKVFWNRIHLHDALFNTCIIWTLSSSFYSVRECLQLEIDLWIFLAYIYKLMTNRSSAMNNRIIVPDNECRIDCYVVVVVVLFTWVHVCDVITRGIPMWIYCKWCCCVVNMHIANFAGSSRFEIGRLIIWMPWLPALQQWSMVFCTISYFMSSHVRLTCFFSGSEWLDWCKFAYW